MQNFTPEQIAEMHDRNESFEGHSADLKKVFAYNEIRTSLNALMDKLDGAMQLSELKPNPSSPHATLSIDIEPPATMGDVLSNALSDAMSKADRVSIAVRNNGRVRLSFAVENIWKN